MAKKIILYLSLTFAGLDVSGQNIGNDCGTDVVHTYLLQADSVYRKHFIDLESQIKTYIQNQSVNKLQTPVYTIPVVVHVIHLGEPIGTGTNLSDSQIQGAIQGLNNRFANIIGNGIDVQIQFCLAVRDPNGNPTNGINRVDGSGVADYSANGIEGLGCGTGAIEDSIKILSRWPVLDYYNIWVVSEICNGQWGGYAYYPWGGANDGTVIYASGMTSSGTILTHEVGHGFYSYHTFNGDGGNSYCPADTSCIDNGDKVCDTPPHKQSDCGSSNPCSGSGIWYNSRYNYMSYCGSIDRFTQGQKDRMRAAAVVYPRVSLLSSLGCNSVTSDDAGIEQVVYPVKTSYTTSCSSSDSITPVVTLKNYGTSTLTTVTINYKLDNNALNIYSWSGNLSSLSSVNVTLPSLSITQGSHTFLAFTTNPNGLADGYTLNDSGDVAFDYTLAQSYIVTNSVVIASCSNGNNGSATVTPVSKTEIIEDWEGSPDWTLVNGSQINQWYIGTSASNGGIKSIYISDNNDTNTYTINSSSLVHFYKDFNFPSGATNITVAFDWRANGQNLQDYLRVYLVSASTIPAAGYQLTSGQIGGTYNLQSAFTGTTITGLNANAGSTKRLVFSWRNSSSTGTQPPAAIDNIIVSYNTAGAYNYVWNTVPVQTTATVSNLSPGTYSVTITNADSCTSTVSVTITPITPQDGLTISLSNDTLTSPYSQSNYWYMTGSSTPVDSGLIHICTQSGNYFVTGQDANGCTATSDTLNVNCLTGISAITDFTKLLVYPNPASGILNITGSGIDNGNYKFAVKNIIGQVIIEDNSKIENNSVQKTFSISQLPNGLYFLTIESEKINTVIKVNKL